MRHAKPKTSFQVQLRSRCCCCWLMMQMALLPSSAFLSSLFEGFASFSLIYSLDLANICERWCLHSRERKLINHTGNCWSKPLAVQAWKISFNGTRMFWIFQITISHIFEYGRHFAIHEIDETWTNLGRCTHKKVYMFVRMFERLTQFNEFECLKAFPLLLRAFNN